MAHTKELEGYLVKEIIVRGTPGWKINIPGRRGKFGYFAPQSEIQTNATLLKPGTKILFQFAIEDGKKRAKNVRLLSEVKREKQKRLVVSGLVLIACVVGIILKV